MTTLECEVIDTLELPAGYTARPAVLDDAAAVVAMLNRSSQALLGVDQHTVADTLAEWQSPGFQLSANTRVVLAPSGEVAGYVSLWDAPPHVDPEQWGRVHPDRAGHGLGSYLLGWAERRARTALDQAPPGARVVLVDWINRLDTATQALLRNHGHVPVRVNYRMLIDLDPAAPPAAPQWPAGVSVRSFVVGQDERVTLRTIRTAFRDSWGFVESPFEAHLEHWTYRWRSDPDFDPSLWFLAVAGDEVIGTALSRLGINEDRELGWIFSLGVLRPWRRQGVAAALLQHCFVQLWQRGRRRVGLGVDADSLTNALHLYEKAGMRPDPARIYEVWEKELRPGYAVNTTTLDAP